MRVVVADATPLHYLILVDAVHILPRLFERIHVPAEVRDELTCEAIPALIRTWMRKSPEWLEVSLHQLFLLKIMLCRRLTQVKERQLCSLLPFGPTFYSLMIARCILAQRRGLAITGTLGVLDVASQLGLVQLQDVFVRLQKTNFRYHLHSWRRLLEEEKSRRKRTE